MLRVVGDAPDTTWLRHVRLEHGATLSTMGEVRNLDPATNPVVLEDVELHDARIELGTAGSRIDGLSAEGGGENAIIGAAPLLRLTGPGIVAQHVFIQDAPRVGIELSGDDILLAGCQVTGSAGDGILVLDGAGIRIRDCNLLGNAGAGVSNVGADPVDATGNWWGDAAGPDGPEGDGVAGNVQFDPWLTTPVVLPGASS
ncbi:MAG TPA: right-handed parallel beta-helix repeat-containing protein [Longimicrobiales bacterium]